MNEYIFSISEDTGGTLSSTTLQTQINASSISQNVDHIESAGDVLKIFFVNPLDETEETTLSTVLAAHNGLTTVESLTRYLDLYVFPFVKDLINTFAAENIAMGITQTGKTGEVLGLYAKKYPCPSATLPISLKDCLDTGSLYGARDVIQYIRDNSSEYSGLSPYITDARLLVLKNKIETFLGLPLSI